MYSSPASVAPDVLKNHIYRTLEGKKKVKKTQAKSTCACGLQGSTLGQRDEFGKTSLLRDGVADTHGAARTCLRDKGRERGIEKERGAIDNTEVASLDSPVFAPSGSALVREVIERRTLLGVRCATGYSSRSSWTTALLETSLIRNPGVLDSDSFRLEYGFVSGSAL